eukprot:6204747-Pleurochrysis_carterae.AAC.3
MLTHNCVPLSGREAPTAMTFAFDCVEEQANTVVSTHASYFVRRLAWRTVQGGARVGARLVLKICINFLQEVAPSDRTARLHAFSAIHAMLVSAAIQM